jgi:SNF2 family DNA or RNA helicase
LQSEDRVHRPGQTRNVLVLDMLATGPAGQKTIDHRVVKRLREKNDLANWTVQAWKRELLEEEAA